MRFQFPWAFFLLPLVALTVWFAIRGKKTGSLRFSAVKNAGNCTSLSWRMRMRRLPLLVRIVAVVLLVIGLARPQEGREEVRDVSQGIAIEMVIDRSGSMGQEFIYEGARLNRLEAVKKVFKDFVIGNGKDLEGRANDLIGMVTFARYADTVCPLTLSHGALDRFIDNVRLVTQKNEDGTAIGDGLALAAARLKTIEEQLKDRGFKSGNWDSEAADGTRTEIGARGKFGDAQASSDKPLHALMLPDRGYEIKSKVIILLTDGQNNIGKRSPREAAQLAREWGIKVYAIGIGGRESFMTVQTPLGDYRVPAGPGVDEPTLKAIAAETGGAYWMAESAGELREIYKEIDKLERTEIESTHYVDYSEKFLPFVLAALMALCLEQVLISTVFRRIP
jgi:Ca-activated chloride channel family protein